MLGVDARRFTRFFVGSAECRYIEGDSYLERSSQNHCWASWSPMVDRSFFYLDGFEVKHQDVALTATRLSAPVLICFQV